MHHALGIGLSIKTKSKIAYLPNFGQAKIFQKQKSLTMKEKILYWTLKYIRNSYNSKKKNNNKSHNPITM